MKLSRRIVEQALDDLCYEFGQHYQCALDYVNSVNFLEDCSTSHISAEQITTAIQEAFSMSPVQRGAALKEISSAVKKTPAFRAGEDDPVGSLEGKHGQRPCFGRNSSPRDESEQKREGQSTSKSHRLIREGRKDVTG
jgi:hypothetical protein